MTTLADKIKKSANWDIHTAATLDGSRPDELKGQFVIQAQLQIKQHHENAKQSDQLAASAAKRGDTKGEAHHQKMAAYYRQTADAIGTYIKTGQLDQFMEPLTKVAAQSGDKGRIDSWQEIRHAAKYFHHTRQFHQDAAVRQLSEGLYRFLPKWPWHNKQDLTSYAALRALKPEILKQLGISGMTGRLAEYIKKKPIAELSSWRGLPVFGKFSTQLSAQLTATQNRKPTLLYPAAGTHYAYLQTVMDLVQYGDVDSVKVIATDLDANMTTVHNTFRDLERAGVIKNFRMSAPNSPEFYTDGGTEQSLTFQIQGPVFAIPVTITYALKRSGEAYFRDDYLQKADAVIIHDPGDSDIAASEKLLADVLAAKKRAAPMRPQLVLLEAAAKVPLQSEKITGPYGHCSGVGGMGEFYDCGDGAQVVRLQSK